jgi:ESS family glutamate:Na+ symporter
MSISLATTQRAVGGEQATKKKDKHVLGGLWMALMWGALISVQIVVAGVIAVLFYGVGFKEFNPLYGMLAAHGFAQGPVQALSMAKTWIASISGDSLADAAQIGLFFAVVGYLAAVLVGVPICNYFFKHDLAALPQSEEDTELQRGLYKRETELALGSQTTHRASIDTLTFHWALILGTYFLTYILVSLVDPTHSTMIYTMMFVWAILVANLVVLVLRKLHVDHLVDKGVQTSITNFCTDTALVSCMMSVTFGVVVKYLVPLIAISIAVVAVTVALTWYLAKKTGSYAAERFITVFGIATGTAISGLLLLRILDPEGRTPVTKEVVWWNIFEMFTGAVAVSMAPFAAIWGWKIWLAVNVGVTAVLLLITAFVGSRLAKGNAADSVKDTAGSVPIGA